MVEYKSGSETVQAEKVIEKVVDVISERDYSKISTIVDELNNWSISLISEIVENFIEDNNLERFDPYKTPCKFKPKYEYKQLNFYKWDDGRGMSCEYDFTTNGDLNDLTLMIDFYYEGNMLKSIFQDLHVM